MECVCVLLSVGRGHLSETGGKGWPQKMARGQGRTESDLEVGEGGCRGDWKEGLCTGPWNWAVSHGLCPTGGNWGILNGQA